MEKRKSNGGFQKQKMFKSERTEQLPDPEDAVVTAQERILLDPPKRFRKLADRDPFSLPSKTDIFSKQTFESLNLHPKLLSILEKDLELKEMTHIQSQAIPLALKKRDVMIKAQTGSGKTLCYLIPILHLLLAEVEPKKKITREDGTFCVIISPTRELSLQIEEILKIVQQRIPYLIRSSLMGGEKKKAEKARLRKGINILVATPGRFNDHLKNTQNFNLENLQWVIFDEADRLLDMGFEKDVTEILAALQEKKRAKQLQTLLVSATMDTAVERLINISLKDPVFVDTEGEKTSLGGFKEKQGNDPIFVAPKQLTQYWVQMRSEDRLIGLTAFLRLKVTFSKKETKAIVFFATCDSVDYHHALFEAALIPQLSKPEQTEKLSILRVPVFKLHGSMSQIERHRNFEGFSKAGSSVLFCTDVASRGIDFDTLSWSIQYDPPEEPKEYIHRVGRTARIGKTGQGLLFLLPSEQEYIDLLQKSGMEMNEIKSAQILPSLEFQAEGLSGPRALQWFFEKLVESDPQLKKMGRSAFLSFLRSYQTHSRETKQIFASQSLHLGHVAKSFGLRESPTDIAQRSKKMEYKPKEKPVVHKLVSKFNPKSEFDAF